MILIDTSAIYALADGAEPRHEAAGEVMGHIEEGGEESVLTSYTLLECFVLVRRRLGLGAALDVSRQCRRLDLIVVDAGLHDRAVQYLSEGGRGRVSLVDAVSFVAMGERSIRKAFAFDEDFRKAGFEVLPG